MSGVRQALGRFGEDRAVAALQEAGLTVVHRNWRCRAGELDVVARDGPTLVVVEVKTRTGTGWGAPAEAVTPSKASRLRRLAAAYLDAERPPGVRAVRFDVVGVLRTRGAGVTVEHLRDVL